MSNIHEITLHAHSSLLELSFADGFRDMLSIEMLRINSPAIATHDNDINLSLLVTDKTFVRVDSVEKVNDEGLRLIFNDGHDSGLFSWPYLYQLAKNQDRLWSSYLKRLTIAKKTRQQPLNVVVKYSI